MAARYRKSKGMLIATLKAGVALSVYASVFVVPVVTAKAEDATSLNSQLPKDAKLYLSSDMLIYDRDHQKIMARGAVRINYAGYKLVAQSVTYDQKNGRLIANGKIEMIEPGGNQVYADTLDVTDNFAQGFINSLRVETTDDTHLAAESGERINADVFVLHNGVYTACKTCAEHPDHNPLWQIKATKVIQNRKTHTIRLEKARFELFGKPIAYLPYLEVPYSNVKRKTGFLFPTWSSTQNLGFGATVPYYMAISPSMDATISPTYYTRQGFLLAAEFRQKFGNGQHVLKIAGINQRDPSAFTANTSDALVKRRGAIMSTAEFNLNSRWKFGWDVLFQSDNNFARTYNIRASNTNQIYLTGLGKRNYFDLRSYYFDVQDADPKNVAELKQSFVHPVLDYHYVSPVPVAGGELSADVNFIDITHRYFDVDSSAGFNRFRGLRGVNSRLTVEAEWKKQIVTSSGAVLTPLLAARGDAFQLSMRSLSSSGYSYSGSLHKGLTATRTMVTAGLEVRYPFLITMPGSNHVIEPIAQIYVRPNEQLAGTLPNDDAQSFVFDATNLFRRNKFSGYDRIEGGTRANVGIRYTGTFDNGYKVNGIFGQSYQIAGQNSFKNQDFVNAGANSGLDKAVSDYVALLGVETPLGLRMTESMRFDRSTLKLARADSTLGLTSRHFDTNITYTKLAAQPAYGLSTDNSEIQTSSVIKIDNYWKLFGSMSWDLKNKVVNQSSVGFSYNDECTTFAISYARTRDIYNKNASDWSFGAQLSFRTLGDLGIQSKSSNGIQ